MENGERYNVQPMAGETEDTRLKEFGIDREDIWDAFREEARLLGVPEEEHVREAKRVLVEIYSKNPGLKERVRRSEDEFIERLIDER